MSNATKTETTQNAHQNIVNWFDIPVRDIKKAAALYEAMLNTKLELSEFQGVAHALLGNKDKTCVSGALVADPKRPPKGGASTVLYLDAADGVALALARAVEAGAKVVQAVTPIDPHGTIALIEDLDGNVIGLHQP